MKDETKIRVLTFVGEHSRLSAYVLFVSFMMLCGLLTWLITDSTWWAGALGFAIGSGVTGQVFKYVRENEHT